MPIRKTGLKNIHGDNITTTVPITDYDASKTYGEFGIFQNFLSNDNKL
jgi:hypothetical protein